MNNYRRTLPDGTILSSMSKILGGPDFIQRMKEESYLNGVIRIYGSNDPSLTWFKVNFEVQPGQQFCKPFFCEDRDEARSIAKHMLDAAPDTINHTVVITPVTEETVTLVLKGMTYNEYLGAIEFASAKNPHLGSFADSLSRQIKDSINSGKLDGIEQEEALNILQAIAEARAFWQVERRELESCGHDQGLFTTAMPNS